MGEAAQLNRKLAIHVQNLKRDKNQYKDQALPHNSQALLQNE